MESISWWVFVAENILQGWSYGYGVFAAIEALLGLISIALLAKQKLGIKWERWDKTFGE
ncbi:MAG: hypothetical protein L0387_06910 [Acidobacteria bacterium]|nr:hypothetical protein [Acidobacteriota bacterium]